MRFRGSYLPVIGLCAALGEAAPEAADDTIVVVMQSASGDFGIRVREVTDHRQIMVKPVGNGLSTAVGVIGFSFSAGGIALVLDIDALRSAAIGGG
jgi:chemotaxis protein histidine kinase CheA